MGKTTFDDDNDNALETFLSFKGKDENLPEVRKFLQDYFVANRIRFRATPVLNFLGLNGKSLSEIVEGTISSVLI